MGVLWLQAVRSHGTRRNIVSRSRPDRIDRPEPTEVVRAIPSIDPFPKVFKKLHRSVPRWAKPFLPHAPGQEDSSKSSADDSDDDDSEHSSDKEAGENGDDAESQAVDDENEETDEEEEDEAEAEEE